MSLKEFDEIEEQDITQRNKWWWILKFITTVLTSFLTAIGVSSCAFA